MEAGPSPEILLMEERLLRLRYINAQVELLKHVLALPDLKYYGDAEQKVFENAKDILVLSLARDIANYTGQRYQPTPTRHR